MAEYIEREAVITMLETECSPRVMAYLVDQLNAIPAADVRPVVRGHNTGNARIFSCSECGYGIEDIFLSNEEDYSSHPSFCPNCGADMREES